MFYVDSFVDYNNINPDVVFKQDLTMSSSVVLPLHELRAKACKGSTFSKLYLKTVKLD